MNLVQINKIKNPHTRSRLLAQYVKDRKVTTERSRIVACTSCGLRANATEPVPWSGPTPAEIVFLGEGPGADEDRLGIPFVGRSGELFDHLLTQAGFDREEVFVTNVVCCRPPENRDPTPAEIAACRPNLEAQLDLAGAWLGVTLGSYALAAITNRTRSQVKITQERGKPIVVDGRVWIPTFHPAYALRNPGAGKVIHEDMMRAQALLLGQESLPPEDYEMIVSYSGGDLITRIGSDGYALVRLGRVRDIVVVTSDSTVEIPESLTSRPRYTLEELVKLGEYGRAHRLSNEAYTGIHLVKKILGGVVLK